MTPERHAKMQAIFEAAIDLPALRRRQYIEEQCHGDPDLCFRIARLIEATEEQETLTEDLTRHNAFVKECPTCSRCYDGPTLVCSYDGSRLEPRFPGRLLIDGKYRIESCLGRGGMGSVYLVRHIGLDKQFALKLILAEGAIPKQYLENFETEARALGQLKHPNIVDVTDYGVDRTGDGIPYLVMEYLEGQPLRDVLKDRRTLPIPEALALFRAVAAAIDAAHAQNIVHGDLKPSNLYLAKQADSSEVLKVVDFGLARMLPPPSDDSDATTRRDAQHASGSGQIRGTIPYMAPELLRGGQATPASDRFAFGVLCYEVLTGFLPYGRHMGEVLENLPAPPAPPSERNPELPRELDQPALALLAQHPADRPASASAAVLAMEQAWLRARQRQWRSEESPRRLAFAIAATVLVLISAAFAAKLPIAQQLEKRLWDARFATLPKHPPDPRLLVVAIDDVTIATDSRALADLAWADSAGQNLERMLAAGARVVAVDLLLPATWSQSQTFARVISRRAGELVLAQFSTSSGDVVGPECVSPLVANLLGPERFRSLFGFVNLQEDQDRAVRHGQSTYADQDRQERPSFAARAATISWKRSLSPESPIWIDYSVPLQDLPRISWKDLPARLDTAPGDFKDKVVIVGADYSGAGDEHRVPAFASADVVPGVFVQALIVNTIGAGLAVHVAGLTGCLVLAAFLSFATLALALRFPHRFGWVLAGASAALLSYILIAFAIFRLSNTMLAMVAPCFAILLGMLVAWALKSYLRPYPTPATSAASAESIQPALRKARYAAALFVLLPVHAQDCCKGSVAVIASLSGDASVTLAGTRNRVAVSDLDWLQPGATLVLGANSSATVILLNGHRYELGAGARATLAAEGLTATRGPVRELAPLPPIPKASPIRDRTARSSLAVRFRGGDEIHNMYPREGMTVLPGELKLSFAADKNATSYRVELKDADGNAVTSLQAAATTVAIPAGIIQPGTTYSWHVRALGSLGIVGEGEAAFAVLSDQDAAQRSDLAKALAGSKEDATALALVADVDFRLGLLEEARAGFDAALRLRRDDARHCARIERRAGCSD